jgi:hypothetical protein
MNRAAKRTRFLDLELGALCRAKPVARLLSYVEAVTTVGPVVGFILVSKLFFPLGPISRTS